MKYITRPGVVLTKVCGSYLLVPTRQASEHCPYIIRLTLLWVIAWNVLSKGDSIDAICKAHMILTKKPEDEVRKKIDVFLKALCDKGFLIAEEGENA